MWFYQSNHFRVQLGVVKLVQLILGSQSRSSFLITSAFVLPFSSYSGLAGKS